MLLQQVVFLQDHKKNRKSLENHPYFLSKLENWIKSVQYHSSINTSQLESTRFRHDSAQINTSP